jgi:hypothetical protein
LRGEESVHVIDERIALTDINQIQRAALLQVVSADEARTRGVGSSAGKPAALTTWAEGRRFGGG